MAATECAVAFLAKMFNNRQKGLLGGSPFRECTSPIVLKLTTGASNSKNVWDQQIEKKQIQTAFLDAILVLGLANRKPRGSSDKGPEPQQTAPYTCLIINKCWFNYGPYHEA